MAEHSGGIEVRMEIPVAFIKAIEKMSENFPRKRNTWKTMPIGQLELLLAREWQEYLESGDPDELLDIANLALMIYDRKTQRKLSDV